MYNCEHCGFETRQTQPVVIEGILYEVCSECYFELEGKLS